MKGDAGMVDLPDFCRACKVPWVVSAGESLQDVVEGLNPAV